ncbi:DUF4192 domain-containing protein [Pseudarthrobacter sp. NPDC055928]|uniref:DUF4192 domain-containing protein n=1 Tax=Pseudarthrobacter sp. NPDC055928 TaxID=3345661 RepID=UPI0035E1B68B
MTPPEHLTVQGPEDILGFIPHSLGYWPADSLVAMTLQGKSLGATLRLDLPGSEVLADPKKFACTVRDYLRADQQADASLLVLFTNEGWTDARPGAVQTYTGLLAALQAVLGAAGMPVRDAWYVGDTYWRDAYCTDGSCCPLPGRPISDIRDSRLNAEMVYRGSSVGPAPEDQCPTPAAKPAESKARLRAAEASWMVPLDRRRASRAQFETLLDTWELLFRSGQCPADPLVLGYVRATLRVPAWRDAVLVMAAAGRAAASAGADQFGIFDAGCRLAPVRPQADGRQEAAAGTAIAAGGPVRPSPVPSHPVPGGAVSSHPVPGGAFGDAALVPGYGEVLLGLAPPRPDWSSMNNLDRVLEQLAPGGGQAAAAALSGRGWISWCRGRGSYAAAHLGRALDEEPGYRLAELLLELVRRGTLCGWAARKDAAWQKFGPDAA